MYSDPRRVRDNRLAIRLDDYELEVIKKLAEKKGLSVAAVTRELAMCGALRLFDLPGAQRG